MGAWGHRFDENDAAADWLSEFEASPSWNKVHIAFDAISVNSKNYVEVDECAAAIFAAEVVAAGLGRPSAGLSTASAQWTIKQKDGTEKLTAQAQRTVAYLVDHGELSELWNESGDPPHEWLATMYDSLARLRT